MIDLLVFREKIKKVYQNYQAYINPFIKFIAAFIVFLCINQFIGYDPKLKTLTVVILLSIFSAFTPVSIMVLLAAAVTAGHVYYASKILAVVVIAVFLILYLLFIRFTPRLGMVVLAVPVLFLLRIPYVIPILLGITAVPVSIVPSACGVIVYFLFDTIKNTATTVNGNLEDSLKLYITAINHLISNKQMILTLAVFSAVILITYLIRRLSIDHAFEIAIVIGGVFNIVLFLVGDLAFDISESVVIMVLGTIASAAIVYIFQFFRLILDYSAVENVQFEDDDYYYYVKAVPKMSVTTPEKSIKRINKHKAASVGQNTKNNSETWNIFDDELDD